jgi:hypothetical protein
VCGRVELAFHGFGVVFEEVVITLRVHQDSLGIQCWFHCFHSSKMYPYNDVDKRLVYI